MDNTVAVHHHYAIWRWTEDDVREVIHIEEIIRKGLNGSLGGIDLKDQGRNQGNTPYFFKLNALGCFMTSREPF